MPIALSMLGDVTSLLVGVIVVLGLLLAIRALTGSDDKWSTGRRGGSDGDDVVCPRCHHRTPPDATRCPECGKSL